MEPSSFGTRFSYLCWLRHLIDGEAPSLVRIAEETGRSSVTVGEWRDKENFPDKRGLDTALSRYFGAAPEWITDGKGTPPQPDLWTMWLRLRALRRAPADAKDALDLLDEKRKRS